MMMERRVDVGLKMTYTILTALIGALITVFLIKTYGMAESAVNLSYANQKEIAVLQQCIKDIDRRLATIDSINNKMDKLLLK